MVNTIKSGKSEVNCHSKFKIQSSKCKKLVVGDKSILHENFINFETLNRINNGGKNSYESL